MSQSNLDTVSRALAAWNRRDLDAMLAEMHTDIDIELTGMFAGLGPRLHGHDGFRQVWEELQGTWRRLVIETEEQLPNEDRVLVATRFRGEGRDGLEVERPFFFVFGFRDRKIAWYRSFAERSPALIAAGLSE